MKILMMLTVAVLLLGACGGATLRPGRVVSADLPVATHSLRLLWPGAVESLLAVGYPVRGDWYADSYLLKEGGAIGIEAISADFTPVLAVTDATGRVIAVNDSREGRTDAWVALAEVPAGARLFVFSLDDARGDYSLTCSELTREEAARMVASPSLQSGANRGFIPAHRRYDYMRQAMDGYFSDWVYSGDFETARVHPFSVSEEGLVTLEVSDAAFDAVMVLASRGREQYEYLTYQDDTVDMLPRISRFLQPGEYVAVVMGYSEGDGGPYVLNYDFLRSAGLTVDKVDAPDQGVEYSSEIADGRNLAISLWRELADGVYTESSLEPSDPTGAFVFTVSEAGIYDVTALADFDICLTLLQRTESGMIFVGYNDDGGGDLGTSSRLTSMLAPGEYTALVSPYYEMDTGSVRLTWASTGTVIPELQAGHSVDVDITFDSPQAYLRFDIARGHTYEVTAADDVLDATITAYLPDGTTLFDDDSGGDLNSLLSITPTSEQEGTCILTVSSYWSDSEGDITVNLERY
jgi:hypothetical protein